MEEDQALLHQTIIITMDKSLLSLELYLLELPYLLPLKQCPTTTKLLLKLKSIHNLHSQDMAKDTLKDTLKDIHKANLNNNMDTTLCLNINTKMIRKSICDLKSNS